MVDGLTAMQFTGLWTFPQLEEALGDDFGVLPWPALDDRGNPSVPVGAYGSCVSAKSRDVAAAKAFVKWLWIDRTKDQLDFATSYGFHLPARQSLISRATTLQRGRAAEAAQIVVEYGMAQTPILWTPKAGRAFDAAVKRIVQEGADPRAEIAQVKTVVDAELNRVLT
jgi:multiple sugar transport system substrate-binding protein